MPRFTITEGRIILEIDSHCGAGISDLSLLSPHGDPTPLLRRAPGSGFGSEQMGCFIMAPWTNRLEGAGFAWGGKRYSLLPSHHDGTAIHGDVRDRPWSIRHRSACSAVLEFDSRAHEDVNFPFAFTAAVRYELMPAGMEVDLNVSNASDQAMPVGCGLHPYFMRRLWCDDDAVEVRIPVTGRYPAEGCLPVGPAVRDATCDRLRAGGPLGAIELDDVFTMDRFEAEIRWPASGVRVTLAASENVGHAVIYAPRAAPGQRSPRGWFCVEPTTMVNNGFNLVDRGFPDVGVRPIAPGQSLAVRFQLRISFDGHEGSAGSRERRI